MQVPRMGPNLARIFPVPELDRTFRFNIRGGHSLRHVAKQNKAYTRISPRAEVAKYDKTSLFSHQKATFRLIEFLKGLNARTRADALAHANWHNAGPHLLLMIASELPKERVDVPIVGLAINFKISNELYYPALFSGKRTWILGLIEKERIRRIRCLHLAWTLDP